MPRLASNYGPKVCLGLLNLLPPPPIFEVPLKFKFKTGESFFVFAKAVLKILSPQLKLCAEECKYVKLKSEKI